MYNYVMERVETIKGTWTYNHKQLIVIMALCAVVLWQGLGDMVLDRVPVAEAVTYERELSSNDMADIELDRYINTIASEIYESKQLHYKELARQEAIQVVGYKLVRLSEVSPHVDYEYMREVVENYQNQ